MQGHEDGQIDRDAVPQSVPREAPGPEPDVVESQALFAGRKEVRIRHEGEVYRLRVTRHGRLILNK